MFLVQTFCWNNVFTVLQQSQFLFILIPAMGPSDFCINFKTGIHLLRISLETCFDFSLFQSWPSQIYTCFCITFHYTFQHAFINNVQLICFITYLVTVPAFHLDFLKTNCTELKNYFFIMTCLQVYTLTDPMTALRIKQLASNETVVYITHL